MSALFRRCPLVAGLVFVVGESKTGKSGEKVEGKWTSS